MIKFFRKRRKGVLTENRFGKYLIYAVGEIVLVVIGILIALQVNNWNEERRLENETDKVMQVLNAEFSDNRIVLQERIKDLEKANNGVRTVLSFMSKENFEIPKDTNIDSVISKSLRYGNYNPANSTILELISTGKLSLVRDYPLKANLFKWLQFLEDTDEDFKNQDLQATTLLIPYLYQNISMQNLNIYNNMEVVSDSQLFSGDYYRVFHDLEFENLYQGKLFWNTIMLNHYKELDALALEIISQTE